MLCVLRIKGSLFCPATFLEVTGLFWLQLLRTLSLNSGHTTSAQKVYRHKGFLSNEVQCVGKLQVPPKVNSCFFPLRSGILNFHVRILLDPFLPFVLESSHNHTAFCFFCLFINQKAELLHLGHTCGSTSLASRFDLTRLCCFGKCF